MITKISLLGHVLLYTSIKIIKNEEGCGDDTVPKSTRRPYEVGVRVCNNLPQPPKIRCREGGCGRLLHTLTSTSQGPSSGRYDSIT